MEEYWNYNKRKTSKQQTSQKSKKEKRTHIPTIKARHIGKERLFLSVEYTTEKTHAQAQQRTKGRGVKKFKRREFDHRGLERKKQQTVEEGKIYIH